MAKKDSDVSDNERALFRESMASLRSKQSSNEGDQQVSIWRELAYMDHVEPEAVMTHIPSTLPHTEQRRLKQGKLPIEGRLDLHGCTTEEAMVLLSEFVALQLCLKHRCAIIVHGKGGRVGNQTAILKNHTGQWLLAHPAVVAFHSALPQQGGAGAVLVLLKRIV